uniref:BP28 C-terminal domain-containing protein n=1 Tax=Ananas comosus var. bracteatus TaxID=296719 RepID=A0A6V7QPL0_ANACO|nr:unnamed protein product [Ananas comosus var. bracteatus]
MATSLASQLQAIKSVVAGAPDPIKRPQTRPSVLFAPKEAADIDLRTILPIALSGLEVLVDLDERFRSYKDTLFSEISLDLDREKMVPKENEKLNGSIHSFLRLLSGHLQLPAALKTLEYLIRRYQVHVYNIDELVLCALPYHDTHAFVRIMQLMDFRNGKWSFLEGVKSSGAPPPRNVLVQQCIRDKGLLETLCNYASPTKDFQHSRPVICFCTAMIVESLGAIPKLDTETVQRVLGFVFNGLNPAMKGDRDHKAGALMVVGLLASRATLAPKLIQNLIFFVARLAQHDASESVDLPWLRVMIMAMISLVQSQSAQMFPKKTLMILKDIRDFAAVLAELSNEFNIQRFTSLYLETLVDYSASDDSCCSSLIDMIEVFPLKNFIDKIVAKVLSYCVKASQITDNPNLDDKGRWAKKVLASIENHYPTEFRAAIRKFFETSKTNLRKEESIAKTLSLMFDRDADMPVEISDSKIWFSLEHPEAIVRKSTFSNIAASGVLGKIISNPKMVVNVQDAILRGLYDDDLTVVQAALSIDELTGIVSPPLLLKAYRHVLSKCIEIINKGVSKTSLACDVAVSCLKRIVLEFQLNHLDYLKDIATIIFPLLLVQRKTWRLNLEALALVKQTQWPFYVQSSITNVQIALEQMKNLDLRHAASINMKNIGAFADTFLADLREHMQWLTECSNHGGLSKSLFLLIILQAVIIHNEESSRLLEIYQACSSFLKNEWLKMESQGGIVNEEINMDNLEKSLAELVNHLFTAESEALNAKIISCIFWSLLKVHSSTANQATLADVSERESMLDDLYLFFVTSPSKDVFRKHLQFLSINCTGSPLQFLLKYFIQEGFPAEVQVESLLLLGSVCSLFALSERNSLDENFHLQLLLGFPSLLIPLSHENKEMRMSSLSCIEGLYIMLRRSNASLSRNGSNSKLLQRLALPLPTFGDFLESLINQKEMISSDVKFLPTYMTSILGSSSNDLLVPESIHDRFDQSSKYAILHFILDTALQYSSYGKLMVLSLFKGMGNCIFQVQAVKSLLLELMDRRQKYHLGTDSLHQNLSTHEIETLCLLLEVSLSPSSSAHVDVEILGIVTEALRVDGLYSEDPALVRPCVTVLQNCRPAFYDSLNMEMQVKIFANLVYLFRNDNAEVRNATKAALLRVNINCSTIDELIKGFVAYGETFGSSKRTKKKKNLKNDRFGIFHDLFGREESIVFFLMSLLDILLQKKNINKRVYLVPLLFEVLSKLFSNDWLLDLFDQGEKGATELSEISESVSGVVYQAQQTTLLIIKDVIDSLESDSPHAELISKVNVDLLIECSHSVTDAATRNLAFMLLSSAAKVSPQCISERIIDIFTVIGESAVKQSDSHSQRVLENLISTLVPCWLSKTTSIEKLLEIFIKALPDVAEHRRLTLIIYLLRTLGEERSLGPVIVRLLRSLVRRAAESSLDVMHKEWEYMLAAQVCDQYSCTIWFPCLVKVLEETRVHCEQGGLFAELHIGMQFILYKLQTAELVFELESGQHTDRFQNTLGALMEQVVYHLQLSSAGSRQLRIHKDVLKEFKDCVNRVLRAITKWMVPSTYFGAITHLLGHSSGSVKKKALGLLCETVKDKSMAEKRQKDTKKAQYNAFPLHVDETATPSFNELCLNIVQLIDDTSDSSEVPTKIAAISSLEILAKEYPSDNFAYGTCLTSITKHIGSDDVVISSGIIRAVGSLIRVLGTKALSQLPVVMKHILQRAHEFSKCPSQKFILSASSGFDGLSSQSISLLLSVLMTLEAVVEKLGGFLNPYLEDILDLIVLHREYALELDVKIQARAANIRRLLTEKIPVRLMLPPLLQLYTRAAQCGEASLSLTFQMLGCLIGVMDRPSIGTYHVKIFEQCLVALDLRRLLPESVKDINVVEQSVIHAITVLTMKLTETMFRPLFLHSLEWAESEVETSQSLTTKSLDRAISFYKLVNKLAEQHRALFVPYFKYIVEVCVQYLTENQDALAGSKQKKKKAKTADSNNQGKDKSLAPKQWHLRALVLKSLYQSFLYDTDQKFLDSSNFQVLLKPIVSQVMVEPPESLESFLDVPTLEEVDETLVLCLGQMAVTARSDVLWKPLNHEVLMQTRNEKVRSRILGLRVVKYLVEHLKEEYLVFLPETIPFLANCSRMSSFQSKLWLRQF